jgi:hypothetical protein
MYEYFAIKELDDVTSEAVAVTQGNNFFFNLCALSSM